MIMTVLVNHFDPATNKVAAKKGRLPLKTFNQKINVLASISRKVSNSIYVGKRFPAF
jgi:hypothetical protein